VHDIFSHHLTGCINGVFIASPFSCSCVLPRVMCRAEGSLHLLLLGQGQTCAPGQGKGCRRQEGAPGQWLVYKVAGGRQEADTCI
jgi:hypothetical protein